MCAGTHTSGAPSTGGWRHVPSIDSSGNRTVHAASTALLNDCGVIDASDVIVATAESNEVKSPRMPAASARPRQAPKRSGNGLARAVARFTLSARRQATSARSWSRANPAF